MSGIPGLDSASGLDTETIINSILTRKAERIGQIEERIADAEDEKRAFLDINSRLLTLQETSRRLSSGVSFNSSVVQSSNENALLATGDTSSIQGSYQFFTKSLASSAQYVSTGYADTNSARVTHSPGTMTIEVGNARIQRPTQLDNLNGGSGIDRGVFRVTDDNGSVGLIDISTAVTLQDVIDAINNNGIAQVTARINDLNGTGLVGDAIVVENTSGSGNLRIENIGTGKTATTLGIFGENAGGRIVGSQINSIGRETSLSYLNDGRGFGNGTSGSKTIDVTDSTGTWNVVLDGAETLGDVIDLINSSGSAAQASIAADGRSLQIVDPTPPQTVSVTGPSAVTNSLGLSGASTISDPATGTLIGTPLVSSLNSVGMASLSGVSGAGFNGTTAAPESFTVMDSNGVTTTVTFTGREDLFQLVNQLNNPALPGANVIARLDAAGTGIEIEDLAGGPLDLTITDDGAGTLATELGVAGTHEDGLAEAGNLNFKYLHGNRLLSDFGFDSGFIEGQIEVTQKNGSVSTIDISLVKTIGQLIDQLNQLPTLSISLNSRGDGFRINDSSGGSGSLSIKDSEGTFARKLGLRGTFTGPAIFERRLEYEVEVTTNDTLNDVVTKIEGLEIPVVASLLNDGSGDKSFRLAVTSRESGAANDLIISSDLSQFNFRQTSVAQDSVLLFGSSVGSADPVVLKSSDNSFKSVLPGVTLDVLSVSDDPVTVSIQRDLQAAANDITDLVDGFNSISGRLDELTDFNTETFEAGPLLGNSTLSGLENSLVRALIDPVEGLPLGFNTISRYGVDISSDGTIEVDNDALLEALESQLEEVRDVFANSAKIAVTTQFENWNDGEGLRTTDGDDFAIAFLDGSADLTVDMDSFEEVRQLLEFLNADGRLEASISEDGERLVLRDITTPDGSSVFRLSDLNNSGAVGSLGLARSEALPGDNRLETRDVKLDTEQGVARRVEAVVSSFTASDGLIEDETEAIDQRIENFNEDIAEFEERINAERERLERQFQAMEAALAESQQAADMLSQIANSGNDDDN